MKHSIFIYFSLLFLITGCNKSNPVVNDGKYVTVKLDLQSSDVAISQIPMKSGEQSDLYAILVMYSNSNVVGQHPYAYGLVHDVSNLNIELDTKNKYYLRVVRVVDGYNKVYSNSNGFSSPFALSNRASVSGNTSHGKNCEITDGIVYDSEWTFDFYDCLGYRLCSSKDGKHYNIADVEMFHSSIKDYLPTKDETLTFNMRRISFGIRMNVSNFKEGSLSYSLGFYNGSSPVIRMDYPESTSEALFSFDSLVDTEEIDLFTLTINYSDSKNHSEVLYNNKLKVKRNFITVIDVKLSDIIPDKTSAGISLSYQDGEMTTGDHFTLDTENGTFN